MKIPPSNLICSVQNFAKACEVDESYLGYFVNDTWYVCAHTTLPFSVIHGKFSFG